MSNVQIKLLVNKCKSKETISKNTMFVCALLRKYSMYLLRGSEAHLSCLLLHRIDRKLPNWQNPVFYTPGR